MYFLTSFVLLRDQALLLTDPLVLVWDSFLFIGWLSTRDSLWYFLTKSLSNVSKLRQKDHNVSILYLKTWKLVYELKWLFESQVSRMSSWNDIWTIWQLTAFLTFDTETCLFYGWGLNFRLFVANVGKEWRFDHKIKFPVKSARVGKMFLLNVSKKGQKSAEKFPLTSNFNIPYIYYSCEKKT